MATIKTRKKSFSVIYWYVNDAGERKQKWDTLQTKKEANLRKSFVEYYQQANGPVLVPLTEQFAEQKAASEDKRSQPSKDITVSEFMDIFVDVYGTSKWGVRTYSTKIGTINNYIKPLIGDLKLNEVTTLRLDTYYKDLLSYPEVPGACHPASGRCVQPAGVKKVHDIIRCALGYAARWGYLDANKTNPATLATLPKAKKNKRKVWSVDTFREAVASCDDSLLSLYLHLAFSCSLRIGEISGLTWDSVVIDERSIASGDARVHINKEVARVSVEAMEKLPQTDILLVFPTLKPHCTTRLVLKTPKTESSIRTVWLPKTVAEMLVRHKREQDELKEFLGADYHDYGLVAPLENGNPVESRVIRKRLTDLCAANGFDDVVFHSLRHLSTGYKLKMSGGDVKSVQGDTGHAEAEMVTEVYSEIIDEDRRLNAQKMDEDFYSSLGSQQDAGDSSAPQGLSPDDLALLALVKSLSPELRGQLLQSCARGTEPQRR